MKTSPHGRTAARARRIGNMATGCIAIGGLSVVAALAAFLFLHAPSAVALCGVAAMAAGYSVGGALLFAIPRGQ